MSFSAYCLWESVLHLVMQLRNSKVVLPSSASSNSQCNFQFDAHQDAEVSHCCVSAGSGDVSSDLHQSVAATTGSLSAERLPSGTTRGWRKWTYEENTELMHCFYLAKLDGVGYRDRLKSLWDSRNPAKSAINVNTLCCHARNIQVSHLLTDYDLKQIQAVSDPAKFEPLSGTSDENPVDALVDPEPSPAAPLDYDAPQFLYDNVINKSLASKFSEISNFVPAALPHLPRVSITKPLQSIISDVVSCVADVLNGSTPSLLNCVYLIHAAVVTVLAL